MGSGDKKRYPRNDRNSQPYADLYSVVKSELEKDKKDRDIYHPKRGYFKNPSAANLLDSIVRDQVRINGHSAHGTYTYVMDKKGNVIFGQRMNPNDPRKRCPHPTLIGGKKPQVQCAGIIAFKKGRIKWVNTASGHYRPPSLSLQKINQVLDRLFKENPAVFVSGSKWKPNDNEGSSGRKGRGNSRSKNWGNKNKKRKK